MITTSSFKIYLNLVFKLSIAFTSNNYQCLRTIIYLKTITSAQVKCSNTENYTQSLTTKSNSTGDLIYFTL